MLNPHKFPAIRVLIPLIAGILLSYNFNLGWKIPASFLAVLLFAFAILTLTDNLFKTDRITRITAFSLFVLIGYLSSWLKQELNSATHFSQLLSDQKTSLLCQIDEPPQSKERWIKCIAKVVELSNNDSTAFKTSGNLLLYIGRDSASENLQYGDQIAVFRSPTKIKKNTNPDAFDYSSYLRFKNVHYQSFIRAHEWKKINTSAKGNPILIFAYNSQNFLLNILRKYLPTPDEFAVGSALLLGYRDEVPQEIKNAYAQTGAMHILAVSGLHVGIIFLILNFLFKKFPTNLKSLLTLKTILIISGLWVFALITGASPSAMRAATMFSLLAIGNALERRGSVYNTLMVSAIVLLLYNPLWLASVGFQLSYLAIVGIVFFQRKIERSIYVPKGFLRKIWALLTVSLAAQIMTGPISVFYFRQLPLFFWLSSLFLVPAAALLMTVGMSLLLLDCIFPSLAYLVGKILWGTIWACNQIIYCIQTLPGAIIENIFLNPTQVVILYLFIIGMMVFLTYKQPRSFVHSSIILLIFIATSSFQEISTAKSFELVVYEKAHASIIEFIHDNSCFQIISPDITAQDQKFIVLGHHQRLGVNQVCDVSKMDTSSVISKFTKRRDCIDFGGLRVLRLSGESDLQISGCERIDLLIVSNNSGFMLEPLLQSIDCKLVVFDSSNTMDKSKKYLNLLQNANIEAYIVPEQGAYKKKWEYQ